MNMRNCDKTLPATLPKVTQMVGTRVVSPPLPDPKALFLSTKPVGFKLHRYQNPPEALLKHKLLGPPSRFLILILGWSSRIYISHGFAGGAEAALMGTIL